MVFKTTLVWASDTLTILPANEEIKKALVFTEKKLVQDPKMPWISETQFVKVPLYKVLTVINGYEVIETLQGYKDHVVDICRKNGWGYTVLDKRIPLTKPRTDLMHGFQYKQREFITPFIELERSGICSAVTRYGKVYLILNTVRAFPGMTTVLAVPGKDLIKQTYKTIKENLPDREVKMLGAGSRVKFPSNDITVCSLDSLHLIDAENVDLLIVDEAHEAATEKKVAQISLFTKARRFAFSGSIEGRFDNRDILLKGLFGPVLAEKTYLEAVEEGAITPLNIYILPVEISDRTYLQGKDQKFARNNAYLHEVLRNKHLRSVIKELCENAIPDDWQTLIFSEQEKGQDFLKAEVSAEVLAMDKKFKEDKGSRESSVEKMEQNVIKRAIASEIWNQGVSFKDLRVVINASGGGTSTKIIQRPGRLLQNSEGKKAGVLIDFHFKRSGDAEKSEDMSKLEKESLNRIKYYKKKGYNVFELNTVEEFKKEIEKLK